MSDPISDIAKALGDIGRRLRGLESARAPRLPYTVVDNAVGDGVTDDTDAIQYAIDELAAQPVNSGRRSLWVPPGEYLISRTLDLPPNINFCGSGVMSTGFRLKAGVTLAADAYGEGGMIRLRDDGAVNSFHVYLRDFTLNGNKQEGGISHGLVMYNVQQSCAIKNIRSLYCSGNGFYLHRGTTTYGGANVYENCWSIENDDGGWYINVHYNTFIECHGENLVPLVAGKYQFNVKAYGNTFIACRGERSDPIFYLEDADQTLINCNGYGGAPPYNALIQVPVAATNAGGLHIISAKSNTGWNYTLDDMVTGMKFVDSPLTYHSKSGVYVDYSATSTIVGWSAFTYREIRFERSGNKVFVNFTLQGTSDNVVTSFTLPYTCEEQVGNTCLVQDNGGARVTGWCYIASHSNVLVVEPNLSGGAWTAGGTKVTWGQLWFEID